MESQTLKQMVGKIFGDKEAREEFAREPEKVVAKYRLTEAEKRAVLATHARLGLVTDSVQLDTKADPAAMWV